MNRVINVISLWVLVFSISCAISKKENERVEQLLNAPAKPIQSGSVDSLTTEKLEGFEVRAVQKLEDFYDYLGFLSGDNFDDAMKDEIRFSAIGLFYDPKASVCPVDIEGNKDAFTVERFLADSVIGAVSQNLSVSSSEIIKPLEFVSESHYKGQVAFQLKLGRDSDSKVISKKADFSLRKIDKNLGSESVKIWEVFLEGIL